MAHYNLFHKTLILVEGYICHIGSNLQSCRPRPQSVVSQIIISTNIPNKVDQQAGKKWFAKSWRVRTRNISSSTSMQCKFVSLLEEKVSEEKRQISATFLFNVYFSFCPQWRSGARQPPDYIYNGKGSHHTGCRKRTAAQQFGQPPR